MNFSRLPIPFLLLFLSFLPPTASLGQNRDTVLNAVVSKPFFYNILKGEQNKVFAGTSEGTFEIDGISIKPYSIYKGYITADKSGKPIPDKNGVKFHRSYAYSHLLPYPEMGRERSYHVGKDKLFYICSGGRLFIFDIIPYQYTYQNHSIRSISKNLTGTYSGIYLNNKKLPEPPPPFTDGYVRQIGDRGFICSYPLYILEKDAMESGKLIEGTNFFMYNGPDDLLISDITATRDGRSYYIATLDKLILADYAFKKDRVLFKKKDKDLPIILIPGAVDKLFFTAGKELLSLSYSDQKFSSLLTLEEPIQAATFLGDQIYLITQNTLFRYNSEGKLEELAQVEQAHTLLAVLGDQLLIGSNLGLFHYNLVNNALSVVIKNVEFNKGALYSEFDPVQSIDNIHAGSINGLYTFRLSHLPELIETNRVQLSENEIFSKTNLLFGISAILLVIMLGISTWRYRTKLKSAHQIIDQLTAPSEAATRDQVEDYILNNLAAASIKSILEKFNLNAPQLYTILTPDKPGSIIQNLRMDMVKNMREEGKPISEIAAATGFSVSYLKKLKT
jgi:AraC-like DNA-binding protein